MAPKHTHGEKPDIQQTLLDFKTQKVPQRGFPSVGLRRMRCAQGPAGQGCRNEESPRGMLWRHDAASIVKPDCRQMHKRPAGGDPPTGLLGARGARRPARTPRKRRTPAGPSGAGVRSAHIEKRPPRARRPALPQPRAAVLSAKAGLTAGFGMGPGAPRLCGRARGGRSPAALSMEPARNPSPGRPWRPHGGHGSKMRIALGALIEDAKSSGY